MSRTSSTVPSSSTHFSLDPSFATYDVDLFIDGTDANGEVYSAAELSAQHSQFRHSHPSIDIDVYDNPSDYILTVQDVLNDPNSSPNLANQPFSSQFWGSCDQLKSPATPSSAELTTGSTMTSQLSQQSSLTAASYDDPFDMVQVEPNTSPFLIDGQLGSPATISFSSSQKTNGPPPITFADSQQTFPFSHFDHHGVEDANSSRPSPFIVPMAQVSSFAPNEPMQEDMDRSISSDSATSRSSLESRAQRRRQEQIARSAQRIAPKPCGDGGEAMLPLQSSAHKMVRIESEDGTSKEVARIMKAPYVRPQHPKIMCKHCNDHPDGFRGEHELRRHTDRVHALMRKVWVTVDVSPDKKFLAGCKACRSGKRYGVYYNAAAHLRRAHFAPRKRGRKCKGDEKRGGKAGGDWPPMDWLKQQGWLLEVEELVPDQPSDDMSETRQEQSPSMESFHYEDSTPMHGFHFNTGGFGTHFS
jgi:hypothetical protein